MHRIISIIQETVQADAASGKIADVDAYCEYFAKLRPDMSREDIEDVVLDAVASFGGALHRHGGQSVQH